MARRQRGESRLRPAPFCAHEQKGGDRRDEGLSERSDKSIYEENAAFRHVVCFLNGFRVGFASLLVLAAVTSALAGGGLVGSAVGPTPNAVSSTYSTSESSPATTTTKATGSPATSSRTVTSTSSTVSSVTTNTSTSTQTTVSSSTAVSSATVATTTTTTVAGQTTTVTEPGQAITTTTTIVTTTAAGSTVTITVVGSATTAVASTTTAGGGLGFFGVASQGETLLREAQSISLLLAPICWILLGGAWIWRGRVRSQWTRMGFGSDVFELFMKMKGGATRIKVLNTLTTPKDRLQLAEELGVDWKTVDRHVQILSRYGFVREQATYGTLKLYEVTPMGKMMLNLFEELERTNGQVTRQPSPTQSGERTRLE